MVGMSRDTGRLSLTNSCRDADDLPRCTDTSSPKPDGDVIARRCSIVLRPCIRSPTDRLQRWVQISVCDTRAVNRLIKLEGESFTRCNAPPWRFASPPSSACLLPSLISVSNFSNWLGQELRVSVTFHSASTGSVANHLTPWS
jgi:hypothetical protein